MARILMTTSESEPVTLEGASGEWWLPGQEGHRVPGTLTYSANEGGWLELYGVLTPIVWDGSPEAGQWKGAIFGVTKDHQRITLMDARLARQSFKSRMDKREVKAECFSFRTAALDGHLPDGIDTRFSYFTLRAAVLPWWMYRPVPEYEGGLGKPHVLKLEIPAPYEAQLTTGELTLGWHDGEGWGEEEGHYVVARATWAYRPVEPLTIGEASEAFVVPMLRFGTLATGAPDAALEVRAVGAAGVRGGSGTIIHDGWPVADQSLRDFVGPNHLIRFRAVDSRFETMMQGWERLRLTQGTELGLSVAGSVRSSEVLSDAFGTCVRALEQWHEALIGGHLMEDEHYAEILGRIEGSLTADEWKLVSPRIVRGNRPSLKVRLEQLAEHADWMIGLWMLETPRFLRRVVDHRDGLVHGFDRSPPFTQEELWWALQLLRCLLQQLVLNEIGFNRAEAGVAMSQSAQSQSACDPRRNVLEIQSKRSGDNIRESQVWVERGPTVGHDLFPPPEDH